MTCNGEIYFQIVNTLGDANANKYIFSLQIQSLEKQDVLFWDTGNKSCVTPQC